MDMDQATLNEDWIKTLSWDLPKTLDGVVWAMGAVNKDDAGKADALRHMMTLPAWTAAPAALKKDVEEFLDKKFPVLGRGTRRWNESRDWATWDADHPYVPHPKELSGNSSSAKTEGPANTVNGQVVAQQLTGEPPPPQSVHVTTDDLQHVINACAAMPKDTDPSPNLHNLSIDGAGNEHLFNQCTLCIPRSEMPVISNTADAVKFMGELDGIHGISAKMENVDPRTLTATQSQLDGIKVGGMAQYSADHNGNLIGEPPPNVLVIDKNGSILDGHHRWAAAATYAATHPGYTVPVMRVNTTIDKLVPLAHQYDATQSGHEKAKAFGARMQNLLYVMRKLDPSTGSWATPPADAPPPPSKGGPWFWFQGEGWVLMATDTADGVPRALDHVGKAAPHE